MIEDAVWPALASPQPYKAGLSESEYEAYYIGMHEGAKAVINRLREMGETVAADRLEQFV